MFISAHTLFLQVLIGITQDYPVASLVCRVLRSLDDPGEEEVMATILLYLSHRYSQYRELAFPIEFKELVYLIVEEGPHSTCS